MSEQSSPSESWDCYVCFLEQSHCGSRAVPQQSKRVLKAVPGLLSGTALVSVLMHCLSMTMSSRCKKPYILLWTEKAVLLVLWTCGDVEVNPGPTENTSTTSRSQILRSFRRRSQKDLVKLIYQHAGEEIPKEIFKHHPPGWGDYKPEIEFGNISNLPTGSSCNLGSKEDNIFSKIIHILQNKTYVPLSPEWESLLRHYNNLNTKIKQEESKKAIIRWLHEKKLTTTLQAYAEEVEDPSVEIWRACLAIVQKSSNKEPSLGIQVTKQYDYNDLKTYPNIHAEYKISHEKSTSKDIHNEHLLKNQEERAPEGAERSDQEYLEDQSAKLKVCRQRKRRRHSNENTLAPANKMVKRTGTDLVECQRNPDGLNLSNLEENENYPVVNADPELLMTLLDNIFSSENSLVEKDLLHQESLQMDILEVFFIHRLACA
ncbi:uncharacterized protein LOC134240487 [Saccostrea cucullata]|uniref:uncharacterized protein LOC134240487 n=1 Tax=Saccostrea cuccullata TaxID=36930 RepID=UPI002ED67797